MFVMSSLVSGVSGSFVLISSGWHRRGITGTELVLFVWEYGCHDTSIYVWVMDGHGLWWLVCLVVVVTWFCFVVFFGFTNGNIVP